MKSCLHDHSLQQISGIGPGRAKLLSRLGIKTVSDALYYLPYRYEDRRAGCSIANLRSDSIQAVTGKVLSAKTVVIPSRRSNTPRKLLKIFELTIGDGTGLLKGKWFNQPYMKNVFSRGRKVVLSGVVRRDPYGGGYMLQSPDYEFIGNESQKVIHTSRIVPIYRTLSGLGVRTLRTIIYSVIEFAGADISEYMPEELLKRHDLPGIKEALLNIHFPPDTADLESLNEGRSQFHKRLAYDELLCLQTGLAVMKRGVSASKGISSGSEGRLAERLLELLPFNLTDAQKRVSDEILGDMKRSAPMNRLLQGDVGSGKTVVALIAMIRAVESGYQAALMAPTEILAEQHYSNIHGLTEQLGLSAILLTGSIKDKPIEEIEAGDVDIVIGTHALIQEGVNFNNLGIAVIDEQHRFGVRQRAGIRMKGCNPDVLVMTATPIPRTLALTLYGDLNCSVIDELPPDRRPVITRFFNEKQKSLLYSHIRTEAGKGRQVYIVYPAIEDSENMPLRSAVPGEEAFRKSFPELRVGLIHGRMKADDRDKVMQLFKRGHLDILVSTTVIEVGVDVPNASLMLIVHAERFGIAQLHQLRGRVGRGSHQSYCFLLTYGKLSEEARIRLDAMVKCSDGFRIAEEDFKLRGPGEFFGARQSGIPDLKVADLIRDGRLLGMARTDAFEIVKNDPELADYGPLKEIVEKFWHGRIEIFRTG